jgi:hypothetical protein
MCGCAKQDKELNLPQSFESEESAELTALKLANRMNKDYCKKHRFYVEKEENSFIIKVELSCKE